MFRPQMLAIFKLYNENLSISYIGIVGSVYRILDIVISRHNTLSMYGS